MNIGLLLYRDCLPAGLFGFSDLLMAVNQRAGRELFRCQWVSEAGGPLQTANGIALATERLGASRLDGVVVPGAWRDADNAVADADAGLVESLAGLPASTRLWSYCTGVCLVAGTGRLDGVPATTTWWLRDLAGSRFPLVDWRPHQTLVRTGHDDTAAGVNGYLPLGLALLEEQCGGQAVEEIRRHMVLPRPEDHHTPLQDVPGLFRQSLWLRDVIRWVERTPAHGLIIDRLAEFMSTSSRTLQRRVLRESGHRCGQLMRLVKLNQVGEQLISTDRPLAAIGDALGFQDEASLRRSFRQVSGMTPGEYRKHFGR